jgi:predicted nucleotidyltransferase
MARTAVGLTAEELEAYRCAARLREQQVRQGLAERQVRAWALARRAANLLRTRFGAKQVVVFGSLVHEGCFTLWSDVDLAAWGLRSEDTFRAIGAIQDLDADVELNLIDVGICSPSLLAVIEAEGIEL